MPKLYLPHFRPTDSFLYAGVDTLITSLDLAAQTPTSRKVSYLGLTEEQFLIGFMFDSD